MKNNLVKAIVLLFALGTGAVALLKKKMQFHPRFQIRKIRNFSPSVGFQLHKIQKDSYSWRRFFHESPFSLWILFFIALSLTSAPFVEQYSYLLRASLIGLTPTEFTGTVMPIEKVPNWVELTEAERGAQFDEIPVSKLIPLPEYDPLAMQKGKNFQTGHDQERNAWLTYPVPNLGNYQLDGTENSGSHTGIDIKAPIGTPVHAIANGVVYKVQNQPTGFGKHVVLAHVGIPDPDNASQKTTLFSGYAHLSETLVREGAKVEKGEIIGKVGDTGMATSPHLHFQIDRTDAPFVLYWPIAWTDVQSAGLSSFFEAVKQGIGKNQGEKYTVHPVRFVEKFVHYVGSAQLVASTIIPSEAVEDEEAASQPTAETNIEAEEEISKPNVHYSATSQRGNLRATDEDLIFETERYFVPGETKIVELRASNPELVAQNGIEVSSTLRDLAKIEPSRLTPEDFHEGVAQIKVQTQEGRTFKLVAKGEFGEIKSQSLRAMIFKDVAEGDSSGQAIKFLKEKGVITGYPDGTFRPEGTLNRAEAVKILLNANNIEPEESETPFVDVETNDWFASYVGTAVRKGIVRGYGDGTFKPANTISRAEFLKIAIESAGIETRTEFDRDPYPDVHEDDWFAPYFEVAKQKGLLSTKRGGYVVPSQPITRAESADLMYRLEKLEE